MFTQLDLFGDMPSPEKQPDKPSRPERRSNARNTGSGATPPVQAQLSMGLPEQETPDQLRMFGETRVEERVEENTKQEADNTDSTFTSTIASPEVAFTAGADTLSAPVEYQPDTQPEVPIIREASGPGPTAIQTNPGTQAAGEASDNKIGDKNSTPGKRYYIQTEIPADPPLEPRQTTAILETFIPPPARQINPEPKPRYIQTEIPSDPPVNDAVKAEQTESANPANSIKVQPAGQIETETETGLAADAPVSYSSDTEKKPKITGIPPESLRRTRPLMPPKVILAEPAAELPKPLKSSVDVEGEQQNVKTEAETDRKDLPSIFHEKTSISKHDDAEVDATEDKSTGIDDSASEPIHASAVTKEDAFSPATEPTKAAVTADLSGKKTTGRSRKPLREAPLETTHTGIPADDVLNSRQYYSIGEVAIMFSVKPSLLRYWESEFDVLKLRKNRKGDRFFRPDDIRSLQLIHHLLREKKYTIEGAREYMRNARKMKEKFETIEALQRIRQFLVEMRNGLQMENIGDLH